MLLDVALGVLIAKICSIIFSIELDPTLITAGILFAVLPDFDLFKIIFRKNKQAGNKDYEHRDIFHYPLIFLTIGTILAAVFGGTPWVFLFFFTTILHFIHDSIGIGWGVKWLHPFSQKSFSFLYHYEMDRRGLTKKLIYSWSPEEIEILSETGDKNWIKNIYLRFHPYSVAEHILTIAILVYVLL